MRGSRVWLASVASLALTLVLATVAYGAPIKKQFTLNVVPDAPPVTVNQPETYSVRIDNKAATQQLGSCNITLPAPPGSPAQLQNISVTHPVITGTNIQSGTATLVGNVVQLRNMSTPAMGARTFTFTGTAPQTGTYELAGWECRQANNYAPDAPSNRFTINLLGSDIDWLVSAPPVPSRDLRVDFGGVVESTAYAGDTPDPGTINNRVLYTITVKNNDPSLTVSGVTLSTTLAGPAGTAFSEIPAQGLGSGQNWSCPGGTATAKTCSLSGTLGPSASTVIQAWVQTPPSAGTITNSVSVTGAEPDGDTANNSDAESTTINNVNPADCNGDPSCVTSFIITCATGGNVVSSGTTTNLTRWLVGTATFPEVDGCEGVEYSMRAIKEADISTSCPVNNLLVKCDFEFFMEDIPLHFDDDHPVTLRLVCNNDVSHCAATPLGTFVLVKRNATTGQITIIPRCGSFGAGSLCYEVSLDGGGNLAFDVHGLTAGDPYVAGKCIPAHTCGPGS